MGGPRGPRPPWGLLDVPDLLGRLAHKKTNFQYWLSTNPTEKKQHVYWGPCAARVSRLGEDLLCPCSGPGASRRWRRHRADNEAEAAAAAASTEAMQVQGCPPPRRLSWAKPTSLWTPWLKWRTARSQRVLCPPREAQQSARSGGGLKSATQWGIGGSSRRSCEATWGCSLCSRLPSRPMSDQRQPRRSTHRARYQHHRPLLRGGPAGIEMLSTPQGKDNKPEFFFPRNLPVSQ